jgi:outer membrane protein assembly factor BamB
MLTAGYGAGGMMIRVSEDAGAFAVEVLYSLEKTTFGCEQQTPVYLDGFLYAVLPNDAGALKREFACLDPKGDLVWTSGADERFGLGPFLAADGKFFILNDDGELTMAAVSREGYRRLARAKLLDGRDAWAPMALVGGRLLLRDSRRLICVDVGKN